MRGSKRGCLLKILMLLSLIALAYIVLGPLIARFVLGLLGFDYIGDPDEVWTDYIIDPTAYVGYDTPPEFVIGQRPTDPPPPTATPIQMPTIRPDLPTSTPHTPQPTATVAPTATPIPQTNTVATSEPSASGYKTWFVTYRPPNQVIVRSATTDGKPVSVQADQADAIAETFLVGESVAGQPLAIAEYHESALASLCEFWMNGCRNDRYRIDRIDFREGGMIVYGDINVGDLGWYEGIGIALRLQADRITFEPAGMIWGGELFDLPDSGPLADQIAHLARVGNNGLVNLHMDLDNFSLELAELRLNDDSLLLILH